MENRCYGCKNNRPIQREHNCLIMDNEDWLNMCFDDLLLEIDFRNMNHLSAR